MNLVYSGEVSGRLPELINPDIEQVAVDDPRYLEHLEHVSEDNETLQIFGKEVLDLLSPGCLAPAWLKDSFVALHTEYPKAMAPVIEDFDGLADPRQWSEIGGDQKFTGWLRRYVDHYQTQAEVLAERMDGIIDEFGNRLVEKYPFVSASTIEDRLSRTSISYYDFIRCLVMSAKGRGESPGKLVFGRYTLNKSHISIGLDEGAFTIRDRIISHEAIHASSGRSIQLVDRMSSGKIKRVFQEKRLGLELYDAEGNPINRSMNEAVTEYINLDIYEYDAFRATYPEFRSVFGQLLISGSKKIDPRIVIKAYFENEDPVAGVPAMEELEAEILEAYGQNVLSIIEGSIETAVSKDEGIRLAKKYLKSHRSRKRHIPFVNA